VWNLPKIPSFQLGTSTLASCPRLSVCLSCVCISVRTINWSTSENRVAPGAENILYPAESWAPRRRAHEFWCFLGVEVLWNGPTFLTDFFYRAMLLYCNGMLSVCLSVCVYVRMSVCDVEISWSSWNSWKIISWLHSSNFPLAADPNISDVLQREHPKFSPEYEWGSEKLVPGVQNRQ